MVPALTGLVGVWPARSTAGRATEPTCGCPTLDDWCWMIVALWGERGAMNNDTKKCKRKESKIERGWSAVERGAMKMTRRKSEVYGGCCEWIWMTKVCFKREWHKKAHLKAKYYWLPAPMMLKEVIFSPASACVCVCLSVSRVTQNIKLWMDFYEACCE